MIQCLQDYTRLEILEDCLCSMCSMIATHNRLLAEIERQKVNALNAAVIGEKSKATSSRKKRERETRKLEETVSRAIADKKVEDEIKGLRMEKIYSRQSTKQVMIARVSLREQKVLNIWNKLLDSHRLYWPSIFNDLRSLGGP